MAGDAGRPQVYEGHPWVACGRGSSRPKAFGEQADGSLPFCVGLLAGPLGA